MNIQLIDGRYTPEQCLELANSLIQAKINFLERLIEKSSEEEVKMREARIKSLQGEIRLLRHALSDHQAMIDAQAHIFIDLTKK